MKDLLEGLGWCYQAWNMIASACLGLLIWAGVLTSLCSWLYRLPKWTKADWLIVGFIAVFALGCWLGYDTGRPWYLR